MVMKKFLKVLLLLCVLLTSACSDKYLEHKSTHPSYIPNVAWEKYEAKDKKQVKKLVLLYFYSPACSFCKKMEQDNFTKLKTIAFINKFYYPVKISSESKLYEELEAKFQIKMSPTLILLDSKGEKVLFIKEGYISPGLFLSMLELVVLIDQNAKMPENPLNL